MKTVKLALLGSAALAAASLSASADELQSLKAEIEALNARVAQLEAAPAVPAGYQLLTVSEGTASPFVDEKASDFVGFDRRATVIGILPTADMPATTTIEWHGQIRAALTYTSDESFGLTNAFFPSTLLIDERRDDSVDVNVRGRLWVHAATATSVGEVGVQIRLESDTGISDSGEEVNMDIAWGWWQMTPDLQLAGGHASSLGGYVPHGMDDQSTFGSTGGVSNRDTDQMRLTYSSGPMTFALSLEDSEANNTGGLIAYNNSHATFIGASTVFSASTFGNSASDRGDVPGIGARFSYAGDVFSFSVSGIWQDDDGHGLIATNLTAFPTTFTVFADGHDDWFVGGGATYSDDRFLISAAIGVGEGYAGGYNGAESPANDDSYWGGSIFARVFMTDATFVELGYGYSELDWLETYTGNWPNPFWVNGGDVDTHVVNIGIYHAPVSQLMIGLQADYRLTEYDLVAGGRLFAPPVPVFRGDTETEDVSASFVTWFSF